VVKSIGNIVSNLTGAGGNRQRKEKQESKFPFGNLVISTDLCHRLNFYQCSQHIPEGVIGGVACGDFINCFTFT